MKRHEYAKSILAYLSYELVVMHGINYIVYCVAVRNTPVQTSTLSQKTIHIQGVPGGMCQTSGECSLS